MEATEMNEEEAKAALFDVVWDEWKAAQQARIEAGLLSFMFGLLIGLLAALILVGF